MEPIYVSLVLSVVIYLIFHRSLETFERVSWISLVNGLLIGFLYGLYTDEHFKSLGQYDIQNKLGVAAIIFGETLAGSVFALLIIILIDRKIYGKGKRR